MAASGESARSRRWQILAMVLALSCAAGCGFRADDATLVARAETAAAEGDYRAAAIHLKSVLRRSPEHIEARLALGRVYLDSGEYHAAEKEFRRAVEYGVPLAEISVLLGKALLGQRVFESVLREVTSDLADDAAERNTIHLIRGDALLALGRLDEGRAEYVAVLENDPEHARAYLGLASVELARRRIDQAAMSIDRAIEFDPDLPAAWLSRGSLRLNQRLPQPAEQDFDRALELATASGDASLMIAALAGLTDVYLLRDDVPAAREAIARLEALSPGSLTTRYSAARVAFAGGDIDRAVGLLQGILKDVPDHRRAQLLYGAVSRAQGNLAQAEMYLASVVSAVPDNTEARRLLADVRMQQQKAGGALEAIGPLLEQDDVDDDLLAAAGVAKIQAGEVAEGVELFRRSASVDPGNVERRLDLAAIYLAAGLPDDAMAVLHDIDDTAETADRLNELTVIGLQRSGRTDEALQRGRALLRRDGSNARWLTLVGGLYEHDGDRALARSHYEQALDAERDHIAALIRLGRLDASEGHYAAAQSRLRRALQVEPGNVTVMLQLARLASQQGDTATAVSWLERARDSSPGAFAPRMLLTASYAGQRRYAEARQIAEEAVAINPNHAGARNALGVVQMAMRNADAARQNFARAVELNPDHANYHYNLARASAAIGDERRAVDSLNELFRQRPDHVPTAAFLASRHLREGNVDAALGIADEIRARLPDRAAGHALRGSILAAQGDFQEAAAAYDRALSAEMQRPVALRAYQVRVRSGHSVPWEPLVRYLAAQPDDVAARQYLAQAYYTGGAAERAVAEYERLLELNPDNAVVLNNYAWILLERGDRRALEIAESAYSLLPDNGAIADTYGWVLLKQGKLEEAARVLHRAADAMPDDPEVAYHLAVALQRSGQGRDALELLEQALDSEQEFSSRDEAVSLIEEVRRNL